MLGGLENERGDGDKSMEPHLVSVSNPRVRG